MLIVLPETRHTNPIRSIHLAMKEEYLGAFRTRSYTDLRTQVHKHLQTASSKNRDYTPLLEPK